MGWLLVGLRGEPDFSSQDLKHIQAQGTKYRLGIIAPHEEESECVYKAAGQSNGEEIRPTVHPEQDLQGKERGGCGERQEARLYTTVKQIATQGQIQNLAQVAWDKEQASEKQGGGHDAG